jgi:hypothetical protein
MDTIELPDDKLTNLERLVFKWRIGRLPQDVKLIYIPMRKTDYGDWQIAETYAAYVEPTAEYEQPGNVEHIKIEHLRFGTWEVFAGYGEKTQTLVIGRKTDRS